MSPCPIGIDALDRCCLRCIVFISATSKQATSVANVLLWLHGISQFDLSSENRARQLYKNISMLFLFPVKDVKLSTGVNATLNASSSKTGSGINILYLLTGPISGRVIGLSFLRHRVLVFVSKKQVLITNLYCRYSSQVSS